jgi:hypothetical protein
MLKAAATEVNLKAHPKSRTLPQGANFDSQEEAEQAPLPVRHRRTRD